MPQASVYPQPITHYANGSPTQRPDLVVTEEPLEIQLYYGPENNRQKERLTVTMRTPGHDFELVCGFLYGEGLIEQYTDITTIRDCTEPQTPEEAENVVLVHLRPSLAVNIDTASRKFMTSAACGVCGKGAIEVLQQHGCHTLPNSPWQVNPATLHGLPNSLEQAQTLFKHTGGIHAAALFSPTGQLLRLREDVGRHNAVDKLVGSLLYEGQLPLTQHVMLVSGRAGYELVQKAVRAGIPCMAAVGAPTSLAAQLASQFNCTLIGFLKHSSFNVYAAPQRIG